MNGTGPIITPIDLGGRAIGPGRPCFIAAEMGINHNGSLDLAHRLVDAAADAGADAVKFQSYETGDFIADRSLTYEYVSGGRTVSEPQYDMFKRYELPAVAFDELAGHCRERGTIFFSTPTSADGVAELARLRVSLLKNGSDFLGHLPLVRAMAESGIPTVLSTGMATREEIELAVRAFWDAGGSELIILHCTSSYPAPVEDVHLRKMLTLQQLFGCPVGLSDHTEGVTAAVGAVALGGCFIEKHFTLDKGMEGPDHWFSVDPGDLAELVEAVRAVEAALGEPALGPAESERATRETCRLSCVAGADLPAGHVLTEADIAFMRPGTGLPPSESERLLGKALTSDVARGRLLTPSHVA